MRILHWTHKLPVDVAFLTKTFQGASYARVRGVFPAILLSELFTDQNFADLLDVP